MREKKIKDNTIVIQGTEIQVKEWRGKRVLTFEDIDLVHQKPEGTASWNFNQNRQCYISGVDFFRSFQEDLPMDFVDKSNDGDPNIPITLITESGYLILVKSFTDELARKVQRELAGTYFQFKKAGK